MKFNIFSSKKQESTPSKPDNLFTFSTAFGNIGTGDLTKPIIHTYGSDNYVRFPQGDNLYPQLLNQLANQSGLHGAILKLKSNAVIGGGLTIESYETEARKKVDEYAFLKKNKFEKLMRELTNDYVLHNRVHVLLKKVGKTVCMVRISPEKVRVNEDRSIITYSKDWSRNNGTLTYPEYSPELEVDSVFSYYGYSAGGDIYPFPTYMGGLNWAFLSSEVPKLQKENIQNSIYPSYVIKVAGKPLTGPDLESFRDTVDAMRTPGNKGKVAVFFNQNLEALPTIEPLPQNDLPKAFIELSKEINEGICTAHQIKPVLVLSTQGQLGATTEIIDAYNLFEKNYVLPTRAEMEEIGNELLFIAGINTKLTINNWQIINDELTNKTIL